MGKVYDRGHKFSYLTCLIITIISKFKRQWITIDKGGSINSLESLAIISRNFPPSMRFLKIKGNSRGGIFLISPKVIVYGSLRAFTDQLIPSPPRGTNYSEQTDTAHYNFPNSIPLPTPLCFPLLVLYESPRRGSMRHASRWPSFRETALDHKPPDNGGKVSPW